MAAKFPGNARQGDADGDVASANTTRYARMYQCRSEPKELPSRKLRSKTRRQSECAYICQANNKILIGLQKTYCMTRSKGKIQQV